MKFGMTYDLLGLHKTLTSRIPYQKWYDWYKDVNQKPKTVMAEGRHNGEVVKRPIRLIGCSVHRLDWVRNNKYWEEGFSSPKEFQDIWIRLYNKFQNNLLVTSIEFEVIPIVLKNGVATI